MSLSASIRKAVLERDDYTCRYCAKQITELREWWPPPFGGKHGRWIGLIHVDHILPRVQGGTDEMSNLATACRACNLEKYDQFWIPLDWDT